MRAAVLVGPSTFRIETVELPLEVETWTKVKVAACGICGSDLSIYDRNPPIPKFWPGHEIAGYVADQVVVVNPLLFCGHCEFCRNGKENVCPNARMLSHHLPGGFAEYIYVPQSNLRSISVSPELGACVEPLAACLHVLNVVGHVEGHRIVVVGGGSIGLMLLQLAYLKGAERVALVARHNFQRELAARWKSVELDFAPDIILIAAADDGSAFQYGVDLAKPCGRVIVIGNIYKSRALNLKWVVERELTVLGSQRYTSSEFEAAAQLVETGVVSVKPLITHEYRLDDISTAYSVAMTKADHQSIKVMVRPDL